MYSSERSLVKQVLVHDVTWELKPLYDENTVLLNLCKVIIDELSWNFRDTQESKKLNEWKSSCVTKDRVKKHVGKWMLAEKFILWMQPLMRRYTSHRKNEISVLSYFRSANMQLLINHQFILLLTECNGTGLMTSHCQVFYLTLETKIKSSN